MVHNERIKPCCSKLQEVLVGGTSKVCLIEDTFYLHDGEGYNKEVIGYCPYCGHKLEMFEV